MKKKVWVLTGVLILIIGLGTSFFYADAFKGDEGSKNKPVVKEEINDSPETSENEVAAETTPPEQVVKGISYYPVKKVSKKEIENKHSEAIQITKKIASEKNMNVKADLDDPKYRDYIIGLATDLESRSPDETKKIIDLAKNVADYDSNEKNKEIKEFEEKIKNGQELTNEEKEKLDDLLPIKKGKPIPKPEAPVKKGTPLEDEPDQEPGENSDATEPNTDAGDDTNASDPDPEPQPSEPNEPAPGTEEPQPDPNDDDQNKGNEPNPGEDKGNTNRYDRLAAQAYAYQWWNKRNNEQYGYYSRVSGGCYSCWYDCTNFVSQTLQAGGMVEWKKSSYWYYSDNKPSYSWGVSNSFYKHFELRAKPVQRISDLQVGDVVQADINGDGRIDHAALVTKVTPTGVYVTQHTTDRKDYPISTWFQAGYIVYGWDMENANFPDPGK